MVSMLQVLKEKDIFFPLEYYGENDYGTLLDVRTVLENKEIFEVLVDSVCLENIESIADYLNYLYLKKVKSLGDIVETLRYDEDKQFIQSIASRAGEKCEAVNNGSLVSFINQHYSEIFEEKNQELALHQITLSLITSFQTGIEKEVFGYLAQKYNYLLLNQYADFQKRFEKDPQLFAMLFHKGNLEELRQLRFSCVFPIFLSIWKRKDTTLKEIIEPIVERVVKDTEDLVQNELATNARNLLITEDTFRQVYDFMMQIQHPKANEFRRYDQQMQKKMNEYLKEYGKKFTYEIPVGELITQIKAQARWEVRMLTLSHGFKKYEDGTVGYESRLSCPSKGKQELIDLVGSNVASDEYFTHSHQRELDIITSVGMAIISAMWHDEESLQEILQWYKSLLEDIEQLTACSENLANDVEPLYAMLQLVIMSEKDENLKPVCYGAAMFLCAMMEKLLRTVYIYLLQDERYIPLSSATLGTLLNSRHSELVYVFGKDHLLSIEYFLSTVGEKKIGRNIRNSLAHWISMGKENLCSTMVAQLVYFYTDIINTVFLYLNSQIGEETKET